MKHKLKQLRKFSPMLAGLVFLLLIIAIGWLLVRSALVNGAFGAAAAVVDETEGTYVVTQLALPEAATTETTEVATAVTPAINEPKQTAEPTAATTAEPTQLAAAALAASGPLRVSQSNPRYFEDATGTIVYLTGSHTWSSLQDNGGADPPPAFDYTAYMDFLEANNHNFFRLWSWEQARWTLETTDNNYWFYPLPYVRTGPGTALDGKAQFDLSQLNQAYFDRLRERVVAANERGIYVAIVLFDGWSVADEKGGYAENNPWLGHPYHSANNANGINGDTNGDNSGVEVHELGNTAVTTFQEAYVRQVIDTVNDLDNVLFEISNESHNGSQAWQYHMINFIKDYEATLPQQHPVGMTVEWPNGDNSELFASPADWISPNGDINTPDTAAGNKVILLDSDHLCGVCGDRQWVWKSFTQGHNPIFMDGYDGAGYGVGGVGFDFDDPIWVSLRENLGFAREYAARMDLASMEPRPDLVSSGYALASDKEFLVYVPSGGSVRADLTAVSGTLSVEWLNPETGELYTGATVSGGAQRNLVAPFSGDAVLYLCLSSVSTTPSEPTGTIEASYLPLVIASTTNNSSNCG
jgi:hypothetical protein